MIINKEDAETLFNVLSRLNLAGSAYIQNEQEADLFEQLIDAFVFTETVYFEDNM